MQRVAGALEPYAYPAVTQDVHDVVTGKQAQRQEVVRAVIPLEVEADIARIERVAFLTDHVDDVVSDGQVGRQGR